MLDLNFLQMYRKNCFEFLLFKMLQTDPVSGKNYKNLIEGVETRMNEVNTWNLESILITTKSNL